MDALLTTAKRRCRAGPPARETADGKLYCEEPVSVDTPVEAARRDPRRGEIPVKRLSRTLFQLPPKPGGAATNTGK